MFSHSVWKLLIYGECENNTHAIVALTVCVCQSISLCLFALMPPAPWHQFCVQSWQAEAASALRDWRS